VTTYITESAVSACLKSTYNILTAAAAPTPSGGDAAATVSGGNSSQSSQAVVAAAASDADEPAHIDIDEAEAGAIPEPASKGWGF